MIMKKLSPRYYCLISTMIFTLTICQSQTVVRGPYLQSGSTSGVTIRWRTDLATTSKVWYGSAPGQLIYTIDDNVAVANHELRLTGLSPDTKYYYAIGTSLGQLVGDDTDHFFITALPSGSDKPIRAWLLGDAGTKNADQRAVRDAYYNYVGSGHTDMIMLLGDNAYDTGQDDEYQEAIFENAYEAKLINTHLWACSGNHESGNTVNQTGPYFDIFSFPRNAEAGGAASGTEAYYSYDYGNLHVISLDSNDSDKSPGSPMLVWLENDLAATNKEWIIVFFHHPPYSKGSHDSDMRNSLIVMRESIIPILEDYGYLEL